MKNYKVMAEGNLEDIYLRLSCCGALLRMLHAALCNGNDTGLCNAFYATCDLLEMIARDFRADIDAADDKGSA